MIGAATLAGIILLASNHADDRYAIDHVDGARIALVEYVREGTFDPSLVEDGLYGGTRFMPLPVLVHAGLADLTGEYLTSGKILSYATMAALLLTVAVILRTAGCPLPLTAALLALVVVTKTG